MSWLATVSPVRDAGGYRRPPGPLAWLVILPLLAWLFLFVIAPTVMLVVVSFAERDALGRIVYDFTLENYIRALDWLWLKVFFTSIWYALLTTLI